MTSAEGSEPQNVRDESIGVHGEDVVTKLSPWSVADTVARLLAVAAARELKVFATIDHSGEAANVGLHLRDTMLVIFGSPAAGTPVMAAAPLAALVNSSMPASRSASSALTPYRLAKALGAV